MIKSKPATDAYRTGWERTFGKREPKVFRNVQAVRERAINLALGKLQHPHANDWNRPWPAPGPHNWSRTESPDGFIIETYRPITVESRGPDGSR